jgi:tetratricopeptide (TPR) repeat protein
MLPVLFLFWCAPAPSAASASRLYDEAARLYENGAFAGALDAAEQAVRQAENEYGQNAIQLVKYQNLVAILYNLHGKYVQAESIFRLAISIVEYKEGRDHLELCELWNNLGLTYYFQEKHKEAETAFRKSISICDTLEDPDESMVRFPFPFINLANLLRDLGRFEEAEKLYKRIIGLRDRIGETPRILVLPGVLSGLGELYRIKGRQVKAGAYHHEALKTLRKCRGPNHPDDAGVFIHAAKWYAAEGERDKATLYFQKALKTLRRYFDRDHPRIARVKESLSRIVSPDAPARNPDG